MEKMKEPEKNSMLFWFPKVQDLDIPMPKTWIIEIDAEVFRECIFNEGDVSDDIWEKMMCQIGQVKKIAKEVGYPLFLRTDYASAKHGWEKTCYVQSEDQMFSHIRDVLEFNEMAGFVGLPYKAIVLREFIELDWKFKAFHGHMPVAKERRYFVDNRFLLDGDTVLCHHPYWPIDAIAQDMESALALAKFIEAHDRSIEQSKLKKLLPPPNWKELLEQLNTETLEEAELLSSYARQVVERLEGYWSVDFAHAKDGRWLLIDCASGYDSWHPECEYALKMEM